MSVLHCPETCAHNPFSASNAALFTKIEVRVLEQLQDRLRDFLDALNDDSLQQRMEAEMHGDPLTTHAFCMEMCTQQRDSRGRSFLQNWKDTNWEGLKNDESVFASALMSVRPAILELHERVDAQTVTARDLLDASAATLRLVDDVWASQARRFPVYLAWRFEAPFFTRTCGPSLRIPWCGSLEPLKVLQSIVAHLQGPADPAALRDWLWANAGRVAEAVSALVALQSPQSAQFSPRRRQGLEKELPSRLLESLELDVLPGTLADWQNEYAGFADEPQFLLGGKTPRQAAEDPALRPALIALAKRHITRSDDTRYRKGLDVDLTPVLAGLGLKEIVLPTPPLPETSEEAVEAMIEEEDGAPTVVTRMLEAISLRHLPKWFRDPPPKQMALQLDEIELGAEAFARTHRTVADAIAWLKKNWPGIAEAAEAMLEDSVNPAAQEVIMLMLAKAAFLTHPDFSYRNGGEPQRIAYNFRSEVEQLTTMSDDDLYEENPGLWFLLSPHPELSNRLCAEVFVMLEDLKAGDQEVCFAAAALIKAVITELSFWRMQR